jgi:hypothetical protein
LKSEEIYVATEVYIFGIINCVATAITIYEKSKFEYGTLLLLYVGLLFRKAG